MNLDRGNEKRNSLKLHPKKFDNVSGLDPRQRYKYFLRKVSDFEVLFGLYSSDWYQRDGKMLLWPEMEFAQIWAEKHEPKFKAESQPLHDFFHGYLLKTTNPLNFLVFPTLTDTGYLVPASILEEDLKDELKQYE